METPSEFLTQLVKENTTSILNKREIWEKNHNLTFTKIEITQSKFKEQGKFKDQWKVSVVDETTSEKGIIFFPTSSEGRNKILEGLQKKIEEIGPFPNISLKGTILEEATDLQPAKISYTFAPWKAL